MVEFTMQLNTPKKKFNGSELGNFELNRYCLIMLIMLIINESIQTLPMP